MIHGEPEDEQHPGDGLMDTLRIASILALFACFSGCATQRIRSISGASSKAIVTAPRPDACTLASDIWTCNPTGFKTGRIHLTGNQQIGMAPGGVDGQFFTLRLSQDLQGGRVPTWGKMFLFQNFISNPTNNFVPLSWPYEVEEVLFQYDDVLSRWVYLARSGVQQIAPTIQGSGTTIGDHPGSASSAQALFLPPNTETGVFGDNGGFFAPEGNGVVSYYQIQSGIIQFCNYDAITTFAAFRCNTFGDWPSAIAQTAPVQVPPGGCTNFQVQMVAEGSPATHFFTGHDCYINPGNSAAAYATWNSVYNEEIPIN
jgi:hypothetical protein